MEVTLLEYPKELLSYLRSRARCLDRMVDITEEFLAADPLPIELGFAKKINQLEDERERTLRALDLFERKITECIPRLPLEARASGLIDTVRAFEIHRIQQIEKLIRLDEQLIKMIQNSQSSLQTEIQRAARGREKLGKFKSQSHVASGESIDTCL